MALRRLAVEALQKVGVGDGSGGYGLRVVDGKLTMPWMVGSGCPSVLSAFGLIRHSRHLEDQRYIAASEKRDRNQFNESSAFPGRGAWEKNKIVRECVRVAGVEDQLRALFFDGDRFVGYIGSGRTHNTPHFGKREKSAVAPITAQLAELLIIADGVERQQTPSHVGDLLVRADGSVDFASENARQWLVIPGFGTLLKKRIMALDKGEMLAPALGTLGLAHARIVRLIGGSRTIYMVTLRPPTGLMLTQSALLTKSQKMVAEFAAAGATVKEIATAIGRSPETVRTHLKNAYLRLDVASRVELAEALRPEH
ncbi:MAG: DNA-binding CsgD family transcriptional regulator [Myxococcota bacterium]|jgi:DNA-binding CsgD family transcriptional regulator